MLKECYSEHSYVVVCSLPHYWHFIILALSHIWYVLMIGKNWTGPAKRIKVCSRTGKGRR